MSDSSYQPKTYREQGGDRFFVKSGGSLIVEAGATFTVAADLPVSKTITSATPATERLIHGALTITPTTTFAVAAGGSLAGVRGEITVSANKSFTDGFLYGSQGKVTLNGTIAEVAAARIAGVLGQLDLAAGTVTLGQLSAVWADIQGDPTLTVNDQLYGLRVTNSMSNLKKCQALALFYGMADYLFEVGEPQASIVSTGLATPSGTMKKLKVNIGGTDLYILAAATWS